MISEFEQYLVNKKIDPERFQASEVERFKEWELLFDQVHEKNFTMQKLNLINNIRRNYPYIEAVKADVTKPKPTKPIIKPKI